MNGEDVQVFEYRDAAATASEAARVSPDGGTVGGSAVFWISPPHFFRKGRVIVLYVGERASTMHALVQVLGPQFAGR